MPQLFLHGDLRFHVTPRTDLQAAADPAEGFGFGEDFGICAAHRTLRGGLDAVHGDGELCPFQHLGRHNPLGLQRRFTLHLTLLWSHYGRSGQRETTPLGRGWYWAGSLSRRLRRSSALEWSRYRRAFS